MTTAIPTRRRQSASDGMLWTGALAGLLAAVGVALWLLPRPVNLWPIPDLQVYQAGVKLLLSGSDPYAARLGAGLLPYTYPPFSLLLFLPLSFWVPKLQVIAICNTMLTAVVIWAVLRSYPAAGRQARMGVTAPQAVMGSLILIAVQVLQPVRSNTHFGQVNVILMACVVVDMLVMKPRWRGVLTGLASMVKLTPLVFVLMPLWLRDRRTVLNMAATTAACLTVSAVLLPASTWWFFTSGVFDDDRPGATYPGVSFNQSLRGLSLRLWRPGALQPDPAGSPTAATVTWLMAALLVLGLLVLALRGLDKNTDRGLALGYIATAGLLVSPVSWPHHWVWVVPLLTAAAASLRRFPWVAAAVALMVVSMAGDPWFVEHWFEAGSLSPTTAWLVLNPYVLAGLLVLSAGAWYGGRRSGNGQ